MKILGQPIALNEKLYIMGESELTVTVLEYIPDRDQWTMLPAPPPVKQFTIATLSGQLLVVGVSTSLLTRKPTQF